MGERSSSSTSGVTSCLIRSSFLEIYTCPRSGRVMYSDDCAKSVAIADTARDMKGRFGAENAPFTSVMELALPFQVQEEFTAIRNRIGTHPGLEVLNIYQEERDVWVTFLNLEMTGLHTGYTASAKVIPIRATKRMMNKKPAPGSVKQYIEDGNSHDGNNGPPSGGAAAMHSQNVTPLDSAKRRRVESEEETDGAAYGDEADYND